MALDELPPEAHAELGLLIGALTGALRSVVGATKAYVMQFSETDGFAHLYVHVVSEWQTSRSTGVGRPCSALSATTSRPTYAPTRWTGSPARSPLLS